MLVIVSFSSNVCDIINSSTFLEVFIRKFNYLGCLDLPLFTPSKSLISCLYRTLRIPFVTYLIYFWSERHLTMSSVLIYPAKFLSSLSMSFSFYSNINFPSLFLHASGEVLRFDAFYLLMTLVPGRFLWASWQVWVLMFTFLLINWLL